MLQNKFNVSRYTIGLIENVTITKIKNKKLKKQKNKKIEKVIFKIFNPPLHFSPFPMYPDLHAHLNEPGTSTHAAYDEQLWLPSKHSMTSAKVGDCGINPIS